MVAVHLWGQRWHGRRIQLFCDNEAMVLVINTGTVLVTCLHEIWLQSSQGEFELCVVHLSSQANRTADHLSRWHISDNYRSTLLRELSLCNLTSGASSSGHFQV